MIHAVKTQTPQLGFQTRVFKDNIRGEGPRMHAQLMELLIDW